MASESELMASMACFHVQEYMAANQLSLPVEVETTDLDEVAEVLRLLDGDSACCITRIMLDNMAKYDSAEPGATCTH